MTSGRPRLRELLDDAYRCGYAVPAFNIVDELSMDAVLRAAAEMASPVVVQASERTVRFWGERMLRAGFVAKTRLYGSTAVLHLDHCHDPALVLACLEAGWDSALFDASDRGFGDGVRSTRWLVRQAERRGAGIEGEFEAIARVGATASNAPAAASYEDCVRFLESTGVCALGTALGTRHGMHETDPEIDHARARQLAPLVPVVLHGGSGLSAVCLRAVVGSGVSKINFSSVLKKRYAAARDWADTSQPEPLEPLRAVHGGLQELCRDYTRLLGSAGRTP